MPLGGNGAEPPYQAVLRVQYANQLPLVSELIIERRDVGPQLVLGHIRLATLRLRLSLQQFSLCHVDRGEVHLLRQRQGVVGTAARRRVLTQRDVSLVQVPCRALHRLGPLHAFLRGPDAIVVGQPHVYTLSQSHGLALLRHRRHR